MPIRQAPKKQQRGSDNIASLKKSNGSVAFSDQRPSSIAQRRLKGLANEFSGQQAQSIQRKSNTTGLPNQLKSGIESLSGYSMDDVSVHYNSSKPAQLNAHAYAQGSQIHLASGQEKHLPHEAWHVVQQKQGRVQPTTKVGSVNVNDNASLEKEADVQGAKALQMKADAPGMLRYESISDNLPVQRRVIADMQQLRAGIITELNAGEAAAGSHDDLLSSNAENVSKLTALYTPIIGRHERAQGASLARAVGNNYREGWYDRVDRRVRLGARQTASDWLFWANHIEQDTHALDVFATSIELLGDELHDRGLGAAKVNFLIDTGNAHVPFRSQTFVIKPEDRSVEKAILGHGDSIAGNLNTDAELPKGRQVNTLDIRTHAQHGTMMEYVSTSLKTLGESVLRKLHFWDSTEVVTMETVAMAFLAGIYDLHAQNVMSKGGAPALIDADVAVRPIEFRGPSQQNGLADAPTTRVQNQIGGNRSGDSLILQYAIDYPYTVTAMIERLIGTKRSRIVPVFTALLAGNMGYYVGSKESGNELEARRLIDEVVKAVRVGKGPSPGLITELGRDQGGLWSYVYVYRAIQRDYEQGVVPHFQYQASNGRVYLHGRAIWQGQTLAQSMAGLRQRLTNAR